MSDLAARVRALADEWAGWASTRSTPRIDAFRDAAERLRALLVEAETPASSDEPTITCPDCEGVFSLREMLDVRALLAERDERIRIEAYERERAAEARALREAADAWAQGEWANHMVTASDPAQIRIGSANRFGEWLRDRADRIEAQR